MFVGRQFVVVRGELGDDLAVLPDHIGEALDEAVADLLPAHILGAGNRRRDMEGIGRGDLRALIGGDGKFSGAEIGVGGKLREPGKIVGRDADDGGACGGELAGLGGKGVGFEVAAAGIGGGIEIEDHRPLLERGGQMEGEGLAAQASGRGEIGRGVAQLERGRGGPGDHADAGRGENRANTNQAHFSSP